jgi:uncharacterized protein DUF1565/parallel beta helix pectate lyase-like protein
VLIRIALSAAAAVSLALAGPVPAHADVPEPTPAPAPAQTEPPEPTPEPAFESEPEPVPDSDPDPEPDPAPPTIQVQPAPASPEDSESFPRGLYHVDPARGDDGSGTGSLLRPFKTIARALASAQPRETVLLRPGTYDERFVTVRPGVTVTGPRSAVVRGADGIARTVEIQHDDTTLRGFTIDGKVCEELVEACYRDKGIYVQSQVPGDGVTGTKIENMRLTNLGGECIRMKYFATRSVISGNKIGPCGIHDFTIPNTGTGQNGEGIYIGTAPEQLTNNPTQDPDESNDNVIRNNVIDTQAAECVEMKESSRGNEVAFNQCTGEQPRNATSGAMTSRGPGNKFHHNKIYGNAGAGLRVGGDRPGDAVNNDMFENVVTDNARGGIKVMDAGPHGKVCGNRMSNNVGGNVVGDFPTSIGDPTAPC